MQTFFHFGVEQFCKLFHKTCKALLQIRKNADCFSASMKDDDNHSESLNFQGYKVLFYPFSDNFLKN